MSLLRLLKRFVNPNRPMFNPAGWIFSAAMILLLAAPAFGATIFSDGFEGAFPGTWVVGNDGGITTAKWGDNNARAASGSWSAFCADDGSAARTVYDSNLATYMERRSISLSGYATAVLSFKYWLNSEPGYDVFSVNIRDASGSWHTLFADSGNDSASGWQTRTLNLNAFAGQAGLYVQFRFDSDLGVINSTPSGVWIDDVSLTAEASSCAFYSISPTSNPGATPTGGSGDVTVTAGSGCAWTATSNASWMAIVSGSSGTGTGTLRYAYTANTTASPRIGTVTIAGQTFTVEQQPVPDSIPNPFTFTDQTNVPLNTTLTSNTITVSGINVAVPISITGGYYSINAVSYTNASSTVSNGNTITVRVTSSGNYSTITNATLTIGGVSDTFSVTTKAAPAVPSQTNPENGSTISAPSVTLQWSPGNGSSWPLQVLKDGTSHLITTVTGEPSQTMIGLAPGAYTWRVAACDDGNCSAWTGYRSFTIVPAPTYDISGTVALNAGGLAIAGATIHLSGDTTRSVATDAAGRYAFNDLEIGSYTLTPTMLGYIFSPTSQEVTISGAHITGLNFTASPHVAGKMVFSRQMPLMKSDLWIMNADGSDKRLLTSLSGGKTYPRFSPDGTKVAFCSDASGSYEVYVVNADGSNIRQLTQGKNASGQLAWHPTGLKVYYVDGTQAYDAAVRSVNVDGTGDSLVLDHVGYHDLEIDVSPDGRELVYIYEQCCWTPNRSIRVFNLITGLDTEVSPIDGYADYNPRFSPDGSSIIWTRRRSANPYAFGSDIWRMNKSGAAKVNLTAIHPTLEFASASYARDGSGIVLQGYTEGGNSKLFIMNPDGSNLRQLTTDSATDQWPDWWISSVSATLAVTKSGSGSGTVSSSLPGISCGADCSENYDFNTELTLTATADSGSTFAGWSGACTGTGTCPVAMNAAKSVDAQFTCLITIGEALDNTDLIWSTAGDARWGAQTLNVYNGSSAAKSGAISHSQSTWLETTVIGPVDLSFYWKVSSEPGYDYLQFYIDGAVQSGGISGEVGWTRKTYKVGSGSHTLKWAYVKDGSVSQGSDAGWVDMVVVAPTAVVQNFADDFADSLANWTLFGSPRPLWLATAKGRSGILDNNGDPNYNSGAISNVLVGNPGGFTIQSDVYLDFSDLSGCWAGATMGITKAANPSIGDTGQNEEYGLYLALDANGDACWASPADQRRHAYLGMTLLAEDGTYEGPSGAILADNYANGWHTLKIQVSSDRIVRFYIDNNLLWVSTKKLDASLLTGRNVILGWRSSGSAGKAYHDSVSVTANSASYTLTVTKSGTGTGTVTLEPEIPVSWSGSIGTALCASGTSITLNPAPDSHAAFTGWSGACSGAGACSLTMDEAKGVTALFTSTVTIEEATDNTTLSWTSGGSAPWAGKVDPTYSGEDAARSGVITHNQSTWLETTITGPVQLSFYWKVSSEKNFDYLKFYRDDVEQGKISGEADWAQVTIEIPSGIHTIRWVYAKDGSVSGGMDAAWIDRLTLEVQPSSFTLQVTTTGSGSVSTDKGTLNWSAHVGTASYESGTSVVLTASADSGSIFTGWSGACSGTGNCTVLMDAAKDVSATFALKSYTMAANSPTLSVMQGNTRSVNITLASTPTFRPSVTLSFGFSAGVPADAEVRIEPPNLEVSEAGIAAAVSITVGVNTPAGTYVLTITGTGGGIEARTVDIRIVIAKSLGISTLSFDDGARGQAYATSVSAQGGIGQPVFTVVSGALPTGLSLNANGSLVGTPTARGVYDFTVQVSDSDNHTLTKDYRIVIKDPDYRAFVIASSPWSVEKSVSLSPIQQAKLSNVITIRGVDDYGNRVKLPTQIQLTSSSGTGGFTVDQQTLSSAVFSPTIAADTDSLDLYFADSTAGIAMITVSGLFESVNHEMMVTLPALNNAAFKDITIPDIQYGGFLTITGYLKSMDDNPISDKPIIAKIFDPAGSEVQGVEGAEDRTTSTGYFSMLIIDRAAKIRSAGTWKVQLIFEDANYNKLLKETAFAVNKADCTLTLQADTNHIVPQGRVALSGKLLLLSFPETSLAGSEILLDIGMPGAGGGIITESAKVENNGEFKLVTDKLSYDGLWTVAARLEGNNNLNDVKSNTVQINVSSTAGYAVLIQGDLGVDNSGEDNYAASLDHIYLGLQERSFTKDNIIYLGYANEYRAAEIALNKNLKLTASPKEVVKNAFAKTLRSRMELSVGGGVAPLYIIMIDHGEDGKFHLAPDTISPEELNEWIDDLETWVKTQFNKPLKTVIVNGFCNSGSFVPTLSKENRIIIASAQADERSTAGPQLPPVDIPPGGPTYYGENFVYWLFSNLFLAENKTVRDAFVEASKTITEQASNGSGATTKQHPLLDDDGDGVGSASDNLVLDGVASSYLQLGYLPNANVLKILNIMPTRVVMEGETAVTAYAKISGAGDRFTSWVEIKKPSYAMPQSSESGQVLLNLPQVMGTYNAVSGFWEYNISSHLTETGAYKIYYYAMDRLSRDITSPSVGTLYVNRVGNAAPSSFNLKEPANNDALTDPWILFQWDKASDPDGDPVTYTLTIYDGNGNEIKRYELISNQFYYMNVQNEKRSSGSSLFVHNADYQWRVAAIDGQGSMTETAISRFKWSFINSASGLIVGKIRPAMAFAEITTSDSNESVFSLPGGDFFMPHVAGPFQLHVTAAGYKPYSTNVNVLEMRPVSVSVSLTPLSTIVPTLSIGAPSASITRGGPVSYTLSYADADSVTLSNADVSLVPTGTATGIVSISGSGTATRTVTIVDVGGNGTLGISIAEKTASNAAGAAAGVGPSTTFVVDNLAPVTVADIPSGIYGAPRQVKLTASEPATIYYTTDKSTPTESSRIYSDAIPISSTTVLKFFAKDLAGNVETVKAQNYSIIAKGDLNGDGNLTLADLIIALQVMANMNPDGTSGYVPSAADVNGDDKIGMAESIYILQKLTEMRYQ